jgi:cytochrome P450
LQWIRTIPNEGLIHFRDTLNRSYLLATNHQALLDIMSTNTYDFEKPTRVREFLARIIGYGLILSEGNAHRVQRKALTPAFNIKNIRALYSLMWEKTGILLEQLEKEVEQHPSDAQNEAGNVELTVWARYVNHSTSLICSWQTSVT